MRSDFWIVTVAILGISATGVVTAQDKVILKDGAKEGQVQEVDFRGVKLAVSGGGGTTTIKLDDVQDITFGNQPKEFKAAEDEFARGKYEDAIANYQAVIDNKDKKVRPPFRQEAWWKLGLSNLRLGKADEAIKAFKGMLAEGEFPHSRYTSDAEARIVDILIATDKGGDAVSFIESEEGRLQKVSESTPLLDRAKYLKARAALGAKDPKKAREVAQSLASGSGPNASAAKVLLGDIAMAEKNVADAEKFYRDALKAVTSKRDKAGAYNGLGIILLEQGKTARKKEQIVDAMLLFLRTALTCVPEAGEPTDAHEAGIFHAGEAFQYLGELGAGSAPAAGSKSDTKAAAAGPDEAQARNLARARENFRKLLREYPQSRFASEAQTRLQKLGG